MTTHDAFDRQVVSWFEAERPTAAPEGLLEAVIDRVAATGRRRGWVVVDRWAWRRAAAIRTTLSIATAIAVLAALLAILVVVAGILGSPRPAPPFGLATPGRIAFDTAEGIVLSNADGSGRVVLVAAGGQSLSPTWSRDGLRLAFWNRADDAGPWSLDVIDADGSSRATLVDGVRLRVQEDAFHQPSNLSWSPDSRRIAYAADDAGGTSIFVATLGRVGAERLTEPDLYAALYPVWSPTGSVIAFQSGINSTLRIVAADGSGERQLSSLTGTLFWPDWAPDGSRIATAAADENFQSDIYVVSADGMQVRDVSTNPGFESSPAWSPDGRRLAWAREPPSGDDRAWIVVADTDGGNAIEIRVSADYAPPVWAPDGSRLFSYEMAEDGTFDAILVLDPAGVAPVVRLPATGSIGNSNWQRLP